MRYDIHDEDWEVCGDLLTSDDLQAAERSCRRRRNQSSSGSKRRRRTSLTRPPRSKEDQAFKCIHCRQFIGAPITGGYHRNHCPNCLYSRHVDRRRPGDRLSDCHAAMKPIGLFARRNGEQVIIHRCLGCGKEDPNRIAADDSPTLVMRLEPAQSVRLMLLRDTADAAAEEQSA